MSGRGALIPAFAQVLKKAGLLARRSINTTGGSEALDVRSQAPFIAHSDRDPGSPLLDGGGQTQRAGPGLRALGVWTALGAAAQFKSAGWSGVAFLQSSPVGPPKLLPCHLPSSVWRAAVKSLQRGWGRGGSRGLCSLWGRPPRPPSAGINAFSSSAVLSFLARQEVFGVSFWVFFWDICDAWW